MSGLNLRRRPIGAYEITPGLIRIRTNEQFYADRLTKVRGAREITREVKTIYVQVFFFRVELEFKRDLAWAEKLIAELTKPTPPPNILAGAIPPRTKTQRGNRNPAR